jgi:hypothetical protein
MRYAINLPNQLSPDDLRAMIAYTRQHRTAAEPFDVAPSDPPLAAGSTLPMPISKRPSNFAAT